MSFLDLGDIGTVYTSDEHDVVDVFYSPVMSEAVAYDRISGYFSSAVYLLIKPALARFVLENGGSIRLLCSPKLSQADAAEYEAHGLAPSPDAASNAFRAELRDLLTRQELLPLEVFSVLLRTGRLEMKLATFSEDASHATRAMFHDKVGLFTDSQGNTVGFGGSMNETFLGLSERGNSETIDVWVSWDSGRDASRLLSHTSRFERLWNDEVPGIDVNDVPVDVREDLIAVGGDLSLEEAMAQIDAAVTHESDEGESSLDEPTPRVLRDHQVRALEEWRINGYAGVLDHATGSGKTVTGCAAALASTTDGLTPVILVPSGLLLKQWDEELRSSGYETLLCGDGHSAWRELGLLEAVLGGNAPGAAWAIVCTFDTAVSNRFVGPVRRHQASVFLLGDEVHGLGSQRRIDEILHRIDPARSLGLSATPQRSGDPAGTAEIFSFFGRIVDTYTLSDGIADGYLAQYRYFPTPVSLSEDEQDDWNSLTRRISSLYARWVEDPDDELKDMIDRLQFARAMIAKEATAKIPKAVRILQSRYSEGERWLVYSANIRHVREFVAESDVPVWEYHDDMSGDRSAVLEAFDRHGGVIAAVKCLDEGVDIPSASHAMILASSRNRREFIQRRGRVLRQAPDKTSATLIDVLVEPSDTDADVGVPSLLRGELVRSLEFAGDALNRFDAESVLLELLINYGASADEIRDLLGIDMNGEEDD